MGENAKRIIEDSLNNSSGVVIVNAKSDLELDTHYNCTHQRKTRKDNGFYYCTDCGSKIDKNMSNIKGL